MEIKNAVICAAGLGSRLGFNIPKCMVDIGDHKIIYYLLNALKEVENVRVVVGFMEREVMSYVRQIRRDVVFVRNPHYESTTNSFSMYLGTYDLNNSYITVDGDMIVDRISFQNFMNSCRSGINKIGITTAKTDEPVYVHMDENSQAERFSRTEKSQWEWSGIACINPNVVRKEGRYVFEELTRVLPLSCEEIVCYEIDTPDDYYQMKKNLKNINLL